MRFMESIRQLVKDESGISAVEYALLLALIGAGIATAASLLGTQVGTNIDNARAALSGGN